MREYYGKEVQAIDAMKDWMTPEEYRGFLKGNAIKYLASAGKKGDELEDINKAIVYLQWLYIDLKESKEVKKESELGFA